MAPPSPLALAPLIALGAALYSSVGHGGATIYLAILTLAGYSIPDLITTVLVLNVLAAGTAFIAFRQAGHLRVELLLPFLVTSVPAAFLGGRAPLSLAAQEYVLAGALVLAAARLLLVSRPPDLRIPRNRLTTWVLAPLLGALLGFLAGATGIGGGIFLSPILLATGWATVPETAAVSSAFIVLNSLAGLAAKVNVVPIQPGIVVPFALAAFGGALVGSFLGARKLPPRALQTLLGVVLLVAAAKTLL